MHYDYLIVGSGLSGSTIANLLKNAGKKVLVLEKRDDVGGNISTAIQDDIIVHTYGPHIFHTSDKFAWDMFNKNVEVYPFINSPIANCHGEFYHMPFNMNTFHELWGVTTAEEAKAKIAEEVEKEHIDEPKNLEEQAIKLVGRTIYEKLIKGYTEKQWGRKCTELPAFIIKRLPVRLVFDNNYFNDKYQGIPIGGYNKLIDGLLEGVDTLTDTDFFAPITDKTIKDFGQFGIDLSNVSSKTIQEAWKEIASNLVYTGQLDQYFDYRLGKLDWRTVSFKTRVENIPNYQGNAVVNYTSHDEPYTRVIEHKHFEMFGQEVYDCPKTVVSEEYSTEYKDGMEPYYPVNDDSNNALVKAYRQLAHQEGVVFPEDITSLPIGEGWGGAVLFGGRLAEYKYYDMAPIIEKVLTLPL